MLLPRPRSALLGGFFLALIALSSAHAAGVRQFSPQGEVDQPIRATAMFSANMVPLGRSDGPSPFTVDCGELSPDISQERSAEQPEGALLLVFKTVLTGFRRCQSVALEKCSSDA